MISDNSVHLGIIEVHPERKVEYDEVFSVI